MKHNNQHPVLWATALIIAALVIIQAGKISPSSTAQAGLIAQSGDLSVLTADTGTDHEVVILLDRFEGTVLVYSMQNRDKLELLQNYTVEAMLRNAAAAAGKSSP